MFKAKVGFAENKYGILNKSSLISIQPGRTVYLTSQDTIKIARDTLKQSKLVSQAGGVVKYWTFPLRQVNAGNVLIAINNYSDPLETCRKSPGRKNIIYTNHVITITDKYGTPLDGISCGASFRTLEIGTFNATVYLHNPSFSVIFFDLYDLHTSNDPPIPPLTVKYIDNDTLVYDTIRADVTQYYLRVENSDHEVPYNIRCYTMSIGSEHVKQYQKKDPLPGLGVYLFRVHKSFNVDTVCISGSIPYNDNECLDSWTGSYIDTKEIVYDTVVLAPETATKNKTYTSIDPGVKFSVLTGNNSQLYIITSSRGLSSPGYFFLYDLSGKAIAEISVDIKNQGTTTTSLDLAKKKLAAGTYLCKLEINGYTPLLRNVVIR
jgi:hypothetical protein